ARNLLLYRYHNLEGARNKARANGYEGAMFPWESADTGEETTPQWSHPQPDGTRIRIWTGDHEQHISSDIAYAVLQYWRWTGDDEFFVKYGAEIVLATAVFWGCRAEYNAAQDRYELSMQIGPDEYHENVNNSAFTNSMVRWHLQQALAARDWLLTHHREAGEALLARLNITAARCAKWADIAAKMYIPRDPETGVLEQFDGFFGLERFDLTHWQPRTVNLDWILGHQRAQRTMVIKQADVVMLMALLGDQFGAPELQQANWDFYYPLVDHGSSLSPSTHAWVAARLGLLEEAYDLFMYASHIDLDDLKGNVRDGIHAAACGGVWQAVAFGFAGMSLDERGELQIKPKLPAHWRSVTLRAYHRGQLKTIRLTAEN
ncbi:MAG: beta-phosphoglucomutase, partial [Aggregatilineales bacterium]